MKECTGFDHLTGSNFKQLDEDQTIDLKKRLIEYEKSYAASIWARRRVRIMRTTEPRTDLHVESMDTFKTHKHAALPMYPIQLIVIIS